MIGEVKVKEGSEVIKALNLIEQFQESWLLYGHCTVYIFSLTNVEGKQYATSSFYFGGGSCNSRWFMWEFGEVIEHDGIPNLRGFL